jgi:hypothetical protein
MRRVTALIALIALIVLIVLIVKTVIPGTGPRRAKVLGRHRAMSQ